MSLDPDAPIRQGDIFFNIPKLDVDLSELSVIDESGEVSVSSWDERKGDSRPVSVVASIQPVMGIVITQDCDAVRAPEISVCQIRPFVDVNKGAVNLSSAKGWRSELTKSARLNLKWFYLPPDAMIGFTDRMGVDFQTPIRVAREQIENLRLHRSGRLNDLAYAHFRERLSDFYRRYPYDEWYPLNKEEYENYKSQYPDAEPFPWQH